MTQPTERSLVDQTLALDPHLATWGAYQDRAQALLDAPLSAETVPEWVQAWSDLSADMGEARTSLSVYADLHTGDDDARTRLMTFLETVMPQAERLNQALKEKLLAVPDFTPAPDFAQAYRRFRDEADLFREANVELGVTHEAQMNRYGVITGNQKVHLNGEDLTVPQATQHLERPDRDARERAWRALADSKQGVAADLDALMLELLRTRRQLARNADLSDYRAYAWRELDRVDYTPQDCLDFHDAIRTEAVPLAATIVRDIAAALNLDTVRPWDYHRGALLDPHRREPLQPFSGGADLEDKAQRTFDALDAELGEQFRTLRTGYMDLESREGKMSHAYCAFFPRRAVPFVLMNVVGTANDVNVLMHETGHAFHGFASGQSQRLVWNTWSPIEFVEIPSMGMEFLTLDHMSHIYTPEERARVLTQQLQGLIVFLPWAAQMDAFQHWLYTEAPEDVSVADLDAKWLELDRAFHPWVDWDGLNMDHMRAKGWQYYHIFRAPFYYLEYAMCYLGALALWRGALDDAPAALARYKAALRLGNSVGVPDLYRAAGLEFRFDRAYLRGLMDFATAKLSDTTARH
ncbi:M3 family oligoendopeptidase [Deinococcus maricopensis]|uniref:Peptidase M3A and M3B thimet/oligopeptidase F n=1 Tax=Deinococcus maricopensis (strain DSM 21211 / LMG 22137 / NRRL B-23946 / LB-34) TaxID=709986 RepID=E8UC20_DEIML|nr:M3 family oligoendopeptidase [Deinococcus maricopensis]ADV68681.1 peptidase M3A and M3B thimet/oligopeptidase F [Deinococcus maricopensis DSM 21211]